VVVVLESRHDQIGAGVNPAPRQSYTLAPWNGVPAGNDETVVRNLVARSDNVGEVTGTVLEHAAELLLPLLSGEAFAGKGR